MGLLNQRIAIETYYINAMALLFPAVIITGENADFAPPENLAWIRISLQVADEFKTCIGPNTNYRTEGIIGLQIFTPLSKGSSEASVLMDASLKLFRDANLTDLPNITILRSSVTFSGQDSGWYQLNSFTDYRGEN